MVKIRGRSSVQRDLAALPRDLRRVMISACQDIFDDWTIGKQLAGRLSKYKSHRVGVYRIVYTVRKSSQVEIVAIGHRKDVYEKIRV